MPIGFYLNETEGKAERKANGDEAKKQHMEDKRV